MTTQEDKRAEQQARSKLESIVEMVADLDSTDDEAREAAYERIQEHPLSVQVRSRHAQLDGACRRAGLPPLRHTCS